MKMVVCAVMDKKVAAFTLPQFFRTRGEAIRAFISGVTETAQFRKFAEDYVFACLGTFDDNTGQFENLASPEFLMTAVDALVIESKPE